MAYFRSEQWEKDRADAETHWRAITESWVGFPRQAFYVNAEADTGSRYAVAVTRLPGDAWEYEGGRLLVSVLSPWRTCYPVSECGDLHPDYVAEKFLKPGQPLDKTHGGDLQALVMTINYALRRVME